MYPKISFVTPATTSTTHRHLAELEQSLQKTQGNYDWVIQWDEEMVPHNTCGGNQSCNGKQLETSATRNFALLRTTGTIIRGVDQDDLIPEGSLEQVLDIFDKHPEINYVIGPALDFEDLAPGIFTAFPHQLKPGRIPKNKPYQLWKKAGGIPDVPAISLYVRKTTLLNHGGWPALPGGEDTLLWLALSQKEEGWFLNTPLTHYRKHPGQVTKSKWNQTSKETRSDFIRMLLESSNPT